jgi:hypothetical protein
MTDDSTPNSRRRFLQLSGLTLGGLALGGGATAVAAQTNGNGNGNGTRGTARYRVTVANLTGGQPLTPPAVAIHTPRTGLFSVGEPASDVVQGLAENGAVPPLVAALEADRNVSASGLVGDTPLVPSADPGATGLPYTASAEFSANRSAKYLSVASMLIATNDGFTGLDTVRLPDAVGESASHYATAFDAGTEENTEDFADLVPPAQFLMGVDGGEDGTGETNPDLAEGGVVMPHAGIAGTGDLDPAVYGWRDPVALVHVERLA